MRLGVDPAPAGEVGSATPPDVSQRKPRPRPPTTTSMAMAMIARLRRDNAVLEAYLTVMLVWASPDRSPSEHAIRTGHLPSVVFRPTIHFHVTAPFASALLGSSPFAFELPDEYWTSMAHAAAFVVLIDTDAVPPWATEPGAFVTLTGRSDAAGGSEAGASDGGLEAGASDGMSSVASGSSVASASEAPTKGRPGVGVLASPEPEPEHAATKNAMARSRMITRSVATNRESRPSWSSRTDTLSVTCLPPVSSCAQPSPAPLLSC